MIQFYAPDIATDPTLPEVDSRHCVKVLRYREGDTLEVIDGKGHRYTCRLAEADPRHAKVEIIDVTAVPLPWNYNLAVAVAPTKHIDRMEWLVEKLTEIGINRFIPLRCEHSERKEVKTERLEKIAVSAMKQSLKTVLPVIDPVTPVKHVIDTFEADQKFIAYCDVSLPRRLLSREIRPNASTLILIGPEGDFTPAEITKALDTGYIPVSLGDNRLRTETAALTACDTVHIINQLDPNATFAS
ncbi:MAG: 16S rRNA (uracil(1498)-N(3))-methyltransferase [Muribaculaceae bacterium]|nr:16S rRNA (uracil(1498)-N(3))-methyltransferase [Muribaculaceae bacterium]